MQNKTLNIPQTALESYIDDTRRAFIDRIVNDGHSLTYAETQWQVRGGVENATYWFERQPLKDPHFLATFL